MTAAPTRSIAFAVATAAAALAQQAPASPDEIVRIEGRVMDMRGEPVPAAEVWVSPSQETEKVIARIRGGPNGSTRKIA